MSYRVTLLFFAVAVLTHCGKPYPHPQKPVKSPAGIVLPQDDA